MTASLARPFFMLELDSTLAQHIVDRAMAILPYNINVMDCLLYTSRCV